MFYSPFEKKVILSIGCVTFGIGFLVIGVMIFTATGIVNVEAIGGWISGAIILVIGLTCTIFGCYKSKDGEVDELV